MLRLNGYGVEGGCCQWRAACEARLLHAFATQWPAPQGWRQRRRGEHPCICTSRCFLPSRRLRHSRPQRGYPSPIETLPPLEHAQTLTPPRHDEIPESCNIPGRQGCIASSLGRAAARPAAHPSPPPAAPQNPTLRSHTHRKKSTLRLPDSGTRPSRGCAARPGAGTPCRPRHRSARGSQGQPLRQEGLCFTTQ